MNTETIKGNWKQFTGSLKAEYGDLTDDEIMQAEGEADKLAGIIQEKYGITKEEAEEKFDQLAEKLS